MRCEYVGSTFACRRPAVGSCAVHGNLCEVHSLFKVVGPRQCDECRTALGPPVKRDYCAAHHQFEHGRAHCLNGCNTFYEAYMTERKLIFTLLDNSVENNYPPEGTPEAIASDMVDCSVDVKDVNLRDLTQHIAAWQAQRWAAQ